MQPELPILKRHLCLALLPAAFCLSLPQGITAGGGIQLQALCLPIIGHQHMLPRAFHERKPHACVTGQPYRQTQLLMRAGTVVQLPGLLPHRAGRDPFPFPLPEACQFLQGLLHEPAAFQIAHPGQCHHAGPLVRLNRPAMLPGKCPADHHLTSVTQVQGLGRVKVHALVHGPEGIPCPKGRPFCFSRRIDHRLPASIAPGIRMHQAGHHHGLSLLDKHVGAFRHISQVFQENAIIAPMEHIR